jgi:hypothetical protein
MAMRTETEILKDLSTAKAEYLDASEKLPANQTIPFHKKVKAFQQELSDALSAGTVACPRCNQKPHGMRFRTEMKYDFGPDGKPNLQSGFDVKLYEVGCIGCPDGFRARASSQAEAVEKWNSLEWYTKELQEKHPATAKE